MKDSVIVTPALALMTDDKATETSVASPAKMGGNNTPATVSTGDSSAANVEMTMSYLAAAACEGEIRPVMLQTIAELAGPKPTSSMNALKNGLLYDALEEEKTPLAVHVEEIGWRTKS
jgi:hypothetical protein